MSSGNAKGRFEMALSFLEGLDKDIEQAVKWLDKAFEVADAGNVVEFSSQLMQMEGLDEQFKAHFVAKIGEKSLEAAKEALEADDPDYESIESLLKDLAEAGKAEAQYCLAKVYRDADDPIQDNEKYAEWLQKAAANGWEEAKEELENDAKLTDEWVDNVGSGPFDSKVYCMAGMEYRAGKTLRGLPHEKDILKAIELYEKGFDAGDTQCARELSDIFEIGDGVQADLAKAHEWMLKAAEKGDNYAMILAGQNFLFGKGIDKDAMKAVSLFRKAADTGNVTGQSFLGDCFKYGWGVAQDGAEAAKWYEKAIAPDKLKLPDGREYEREPSYTAMQELAELLLDGNGIESDAKRAIELIKNAAENGHEKAQWMWGGLLINPSASDITCIEQDIATGVEWMQKSADQGFGMAECTMAAFYVQGIGVEKDFTKAKELYTRALEHGGLIKEMEDDAKEMLAKLESAIANESCDDLPEMQSDTADDSNKEFAEYWRKAKGGDAFAQWYVGHKLVYGKIVKMDEEEGVKWLRKSAEQEDANAAYELGDCYRNGWGVEEDITEAFKWYKKAAVLGEERACFKVGYAYYFGKGLEENEAEAFKWFTKAAEKGHAEAQCRLAECYLLGNGVEQDYEKAREWYCKSAEQGEDLAQFNLGKIYYFGKGIEKNYEEAFKWFLEAAEQDRADAQVFLGTCYRRGLGINKDMSRAFEWYSKSAEQGKSEAQFWAGKFYAEGWGGIDKDLDEAAGWYEKSAEQGNLNAICALGWCYQLGNGVEQDYEKAVKWFSKGAEKNDGVCINNLARLIEDGKGEEQDYNKALELFKKATECDCARANYHIGRFYENGLGVDADIETAKEWYQKAADNGDEDAKAALSRLDAE